MNTTVTIVAPTNVGTDLLGSPLPLSPPGSKSGQVSTTISRDTLTTLHPKAFTYEWWATTTDQYYTPKAGAISTEAETSQPCYFNYDPTGPGQPTILSISPSTQVAIGQQVTVTVGPPAGCSPTNNPCPTSYTYQLGAGQPATATVSSSGSCTASACKLTVIMNQYGPVIFTVAGMANGNPGTAAMPKLHGVAPFPAYTDGYFSGGANPDLLVVGSGSRPSLWLYPGTGPGSLGYGIDIGSEGTGINPGTDGPADWSNVATDGKTIIGTAQVAHGDFTRHGVQDVIAYYPPVGSTYRAHAGVGVLIPGLGIDATLQAHSANGTQIEPLHWTDPAINGSANTPPLPISLVGAGNASESGATGGDDLVGVYGDPTDGYELALWTAGPSSGDYGGFPYGAGEMTALSPLGTLGPDGSTWDKFSLATARPGGHASATVLFALDTSNGQLWLSGNTGCTPTNPTNPCSTTGLIGTPGNWHKLTVPQGTNLAGTSLASADVNNSGTTELWDASNGTATAYTVNYSSDTIAQETHAVALTSPAADWPLTDGAAGGGCSGTTPTTATDDINGLTASLSPTGASWACDDTFGTVLSLNGSTGQAQTSGPLLNTSKSYTVAAWVRLTSTEKLRVVASQDGTNASGFRLQFQNRSDTWQLVIPNTDTTSPSESFAIGTAAGTAPTLGAWTFLVGVYDAASKTATLYVNGIPAGSTGVGSTFNAAGPFLMGRGMYSATHTFYWAGDLAQVQALTSALTGAQVKALYQHAR